ncbi:hypothetical protein EVAR_92847_1 [Eumeta japonica]|uniref:Uncharacterized protein n=1 Tax=Eumeta variegata TaxID=151549 RepID=A0A4C1TAZ3_EUMVA|nr:hypothetical protein EVAR_92847_1 [Eumeta japonica]
MLCFAGAAQKREAGLSNSYGEPLPPDAYGPPKHIPLNEPPAPAPIYGLPEAQVSVVFPSAPETPPGAYGPPSPVPIPNVAYNGPPPPINGPKPSYGPPKQSFRPPKPIYGPPKSVYGPPKKNFGLKQNLPKPSYGVPFKTYGPPKLNFPKPVYGVPKALYGPPKSTYGPPKNHIGSVLPAVPNLPLPELPPLSLPSLNLPAPIYGTPLTTLPLDLKPNFPLPADTYGPPGHPIGPLGPDTQIVLPEINHNLHYGPPQPDPNPRPPHPGIPAPPTPPHVIYDGWKPIPGVSKPIAEHVQGHIDQSIDFGPPPPPPINLDLNLNIDGHSLPHEGPPPPFIGAQVSSGYSSVHHDALANLDLNAIVGGDSNHIDQSKTVFEAHFTEPHQQNVPIIQANIPSSPGILLDSYGAPPLDAFSSSGPYPGSIRQQSAKGLSSSSSSHVVIQGSHHGYKSSGNLPIPYGSVSGSSGGHSFHTGGSTPKHPIKFREPVPQGLFQDIAHVTNHKDSHLIDHVNHGEPYNPPPVRDAKDNNQHTGNHGLNSVSLSIEPSNLFSLPHSGNPVNFQSLQQPSNLYGSPIDSYSAPLLTVGDHTASGSTSNVVTSTLDGTILANLSNEEAAAILKHCPYHEAIIKAAKYGGKISPEIASNYVASLSSLGSSFSKNKHILMSPQNSFNVPAPGSEFVSYNSKDLATASHTLVENILPNENSSKQNKYEKESTQKSKLFKSGVGKQNFKQGEVLSEDIQKTAEKLRNLSEEAQRLKQNLFQTSQNINTVNEHISSQVVSNETPVRVPHTTYSVQIQSSEEGKKGAKSIPSIPHEQLLSEGLLQSILQAIEEPRQPQKPVQIHTVQTQSTQQSKPPGRPPINDGGLVLPVGYEPIDRTKQKQNTIQNIDSQIQQIQQQKFAIDQEIQSTHNNIQQILNNEIIHKHRGDIPHTECDLRTEGSIRRSVVVPPPSVDNVKPVEEVDENEVAIFFGENKNSKREVEKKEPVTEISVRTSVSEKEESRRNAQQYGEKPKNDFGKKIEKKSS